MGLFEVYMAPLYGESRDAFLRLQLEILAHTDDDSLFAWTTSSYCGSGLLADASHYFKDCGNVLSK